MIDLNITTFTKGAICLCAMAFLLATPLFAQDETDSGYLLNWSGDLSVTKADVVNGKWTLPGYRINVYEADEKDVMVNWKDHFKAKDAEVSGSDPVKVTNAALPTISESPVMVFAKADRESKKMATTLTVAFCANDSTPVEQQGGAENAMHDLAVMLNRAVIQRQVDEQQKVVDKYADKLEGAQNDQAKAAKKSSNANEDLEKTKKKKSKLSSDQADLQNDVLRYQQKFDKSQDPKDLKKLTKAQENLVKVQNDMSKEMKNEAKAQKEANKRADDMPDAIEDQNEYQAKKEKANTDLEALKRKLEAVR